MTIDDRKKPEPEGEPLSSFRTGACIRLVRDSGESFLGRVYIVAAVGDAKRLAINLSNGCHRDQGRFVLEPRAKVVIG
jgi:hypothetical protein